MENILPTEMKCPHCKGSFVISGLVQDGDVIYCTCTHCSQPIQFAKVEHHEAKGKPVGK